jgi:hypothetical protein
MNAASGLATNVTAAAISSTYHPPDAGKLLHNLCVRPVLGADLSVDRSRLDAIDRLAC